MPTPKEILKQIAQAQDAFIETLSRPIRDVAASLASALGLPEPPEPPKAADFVEALPDIPALEAFMPAAPLPTPKVTVSEEVSKMKAVTAAAPSPEVKMKVV